MSSTTSSQPIRRLRVSRADFCEMFGGISIEQARDYERQKKLTPLKNAPWAKQSHVYYAMSEVEALVADMLAQAKAEAAERAQTKDEEAQDEPAPVKRKPLRRRRL